jgi:E3 ubiquitin-protein ligase TRIP12
MIDIPLSETFYKWMLGVENTFDYRDLQHVDPTLARSMGQLQSLVRQKKRLEEDTSLTPESLQLAIDNLTLDGASVEDLGLDFILPGYPSIELKVLYSYWLINNLGRCSEWNGIKIAACAQ